MIQTIITCDQCGVTKKESNHWVMAFRIKGYLLFAPWGIDLDTLPLKIDAEVYHLCGEGCASKKLSADISTWYQDYHKKKSYNESRAIN